MGKTKTPRYMRVQPLAGGRTGYYWTLPTWAQPKKGADGKPVPVVRHGVPCPIESGPLGEDFAKAWDLAEARNRALDAWRKGTDRSKVIEPFTVDALFAWFRQQPQFTTKIKAKTRDDYRKIIRIVSSFQMKNGTALGTRRVASIDAPFVDALYAKLVEQRGKRQATYCMQVCRRIWNLGARPGYDKITGVTFNPFAKMGLSSVAEKSTYPASREEYNRYREAARDMGYQSMATAAAIAFELVNRAWDVFGYANDDGGAAVGALWVGYRPGQSFTLTQSKTGVIKTTPLIDISANGEIIRLYPELEDELARTERKHDLIVVDDRTGQPYKERRVSTLHRKICQKAGLPNELTFTSFRHGGATEIGDAGEVDTRAISGHKLLDTTAIYNKASEAKAVRIGRARREHIDANVVMNKDSKS